MKFNEKKTLSHESFVIFVFFLILRIKIEVFRYLRRIRSLDDVLWYSDLLNFSTDYKIIVKIKISQTRTLIRVVFLDIRFIIILKVLIFVNLSPDSNSPW